MRSNSLVFYLITTIEERDHVQENFVGQILFLLCWESNENREQVGVTYCSNTRVSGYEIGYTLGPTIKREKITGIITVIIDIINIQYIAVTGFCCVGVV